MSNTVLPNDAIKLLFDNLDINEKKVLFLYKDNTEITFTQEDVKGKASLSTNDARVALYKLEAVLFIQRNIKGRSNAYILTENGKKLVSSIKKI